MTRDDPASDGEWRSRVDAVRRELAAAALVALCWAAAEPSPGAARR